MGAGKLEARITVSSWGKIDVTETGGGGGSDSNIEIADNTYYLSTADGGTRGVIEELENELNTSGTLNATYTVALAPATGHVTISASGGGVTAVAIDWGGGRTGDVLGFPSNLSGSLSYEATQYPEAIWLPDGAYQELNNDDTYRGIVETNLRSQETAAGHTFTIAGQRKAVTSVVWPAVSDFKVWTSSEGTDVNASLETFYKAAVLGEADWAARPGGPVRWHRDETDDTQYGTYYLPAWNLYSPEQIREGWTGRYLINVARMVEVP